MTTSTSKLYVLIQPLNNLSSADTKVTLEFKGFDKFVEALTSSVEVFNFAFRTDNTALFFRSNAPAIKVIAGRKSIMSTHLSNKPANQPAELVNRGTGDAAEDAVSAFVKILKMYDAANQLADLTSYDGKSVVGMNLSWPLSTPWTAIVELRSCVLFLQ